MFPQLATRVPTIAVSKTNGATATGLIDTMMPDGSGKAQWAIVAILATTADVVSNKPTVCKLQEADDTNATSLADITGFRGGTDFTIPNAVTAATAVLQNAYLFNVDLRGRKRYLNGAYSPQTTQNVTIMAFLGRGPQAPITAAKANALTLAEG